MCSSDNNVTLMDFKVFVMTWNVVGKSPALDDLSSVLGLKDPIDAANLPDIYALGLQEVSAKPQDLVMDMLFSDPWAHGFRDTLCKYGYVNIRQIRLVGIELFLYAKKKHVIHIRNVQTAYTRAGLKGMWGNKGGVSIRMSAYGCSLCFVNSHLAAHDGEIQQRIEDYNLIVDSQHFIDSQTENIITHDYVIWFGDLNFRIDDFTSEEILDLIKKKRLNDLLSKDQLRKVMKLGQAFSEFCETPPSFSPTYKFHIDSKEYDTQKRKPAWTDRVLFRSTPNAYENVTLNLRQLHYHSHEDIIHSDHKPVTASFNVKVFSQPGGAYVNFMHITQWKINEDCVAYYTYNGGDPQTYDWIALCKADLKNLADHVSYVWVPTRPSSLTPPSVALQAACNGVTNDHSDMQQLQQPNSLASSSSPVRQQRGPWYRVAFSDQTILIEGSYVLVYFSYAFNNVLGISEPFNVIGQGG